MAKIVTAHRVVACRDGRATPIAVSKLLLHSNNRSIAARDRSSSRLVGISTARGGGGGGGRAAPPGGGGKKAGG
ncbi:hypothetical protein [Nocardia brasiliensis]|uniref:hypothetical protein n=1 Tax=Nocardia brasiliensis TaxID=37326 RepID=UPI002453E513|nr:hypothetical protein [Nocardia brasiliensis]